MLQALTALQAFGCALKAHSLQRGRQRGLAAAARLVKLLHRGAAGIGGQPRGQAADDRLHLGVVGGGVGREGEVLGLPGRVEGAAGGGAGVEGHREGVKERGRRW